MPDRYRARSAARAIRRFCLGLGLAAAALGASAQTPTAARLTRLAQDFIATTAADDPIAATALGLREFDGKLAIPSEAARAARIVLLRGWKAEAEKIGHDAGAGATLAEAGDVRLLRAEFDSRLNELVVRESDRKDFAGPALRIVDALFGQFLHLPIAGRDGATQGDVDRGGTTSSPASSRRRRTSSPASGSRPGRGASSPPSATSSSVAHRNSSAMP